MVAQTSAFVCGGCAKLRDMKKNWNKAVRSFPCEFCKRVTPTKLYSAKDIKPLPVKDLRSIT